MATFDLMTGGMGPTGGFMDNPFQGIARRRNRRPDTPEEIEADRLARMGGGEGTYSPLQSSIYNQPNVFPGHHVGSGDVERTNSWLANWFFNQAGQVPVPGMDSSSVAWAEQLGNRLANELAPAAIGLHQQTLSGQLSPAFSRMLDEQLENQLNPAISAINARTSTARREALDSLPRALANEAIMGQLDSGVQAIAGLESNLRGQRMANEMGLYQNMLNAAFGAADPRQTQQGLFAQQALDLQRYGTLLEGLRQRALIPSEITSNLGTQDIQREQLADLAKQARKK